mgnify:FL=1|jgi:hypothetical protein
MTLSQYNIINLEKVENKIVPIFSAWPKELAGWWLQITEVSLFQTKYVAGFYFNNKKPEGSVVVSSFLPKEYPDIYCLIGNDSVVDRVYVNPVYRKKGFLSPCGPVLRSVVYSIFNLIVEATKDQSPKIYKAMGEAYQSIGEPVPLRNQEEDLSEMSLQNIEPPRDPAFPFIWASERTGGKIES